MNQIVFNTYDEARLAYNIADNDIYLKITNHPKSLNRIIQCANVIYYVGEGCKKFPGYPSGNQMYHRQLPLLNQLKKDYYVHVFNKTAENRIYHLGLYSLMNFKKKESFEGFTYFEIKMKKKYVSNHSN
jgi:hypothetical protein